jgi:hypothetical protein
MSFSIVYRSVHAHVIQSTVARQIMWKPQPPTNHVVEDISES